MSISFSSWKTTVLGVAAILGGLAHLLNALANGDTGTILQDWSSIVAGIGLVVAKDASKP